MNSAAQFERRVAGYLQANRMVERGMRLGVAVSGGADSVCLLHVLLALAPAAEWALEVLHVNHGIRGAESDDDERFVAKLAERLRLPLRTHRVDQATVPSTGVELWARSVRLDFMGRAMAEFGLSRIATGHTQRDQAETVLFRLLRGAGSHGLSGIEPASAAGTIRPFLWFSREEVIAYLVENGLAWREDSSNLDQRFARNSLRNQWIPALKQAWNPRLEQVLATTAEILREESALLDRIADERVSALFRQTPDGFEAEASEIAAEPVAIQRRMFRVLVAKLEGRGWDFEEVERARALSSDTLHQGAFHAGGVLVERSRGAYRIVGGSPPCRAAPFAAPRVDGFPVATAGCYPIPGRGRLDLVEIPASNPSLSNRLRQWNSGYTEGWSFIRRTVLQTGLLLRSWCAGDSYQPAGSRAPRKLKEWFQRERIPRWQRHDILVLESEGRIVWCDRFGPSVQHAASPSDESFLAVRYTENR